MDHALIILTDCVRGTEEEFNRWYDTEHLPEVLESEGFVGVQRFELVPDKSDASAKPYLTIWEIEGDLDAALDSMAAGADWRTPRPPETIMDPPASVKYVYSAHGPRVEPAS